MMLPLEVRTNKLLSIHIRHTVLEFSRYILQIITSDGKSFLTKETDRTMVFI